MGFKHALTSAYQRAFRTKSRKLVAAGIALVGAVLGVSIAFAADPGVSSKIDYAMNLNGTSQWGYNSGQVIPATGDFTVEAYFKENVGVTSPDPIISQGSNKDAAGGFSIYVDNYWNNRALVFDTPAGSYSYTYGQYVQGDWSHVALTYAASSKTWLVYLNGNLVYTLVWDPVNTLNPGFYVGKFPDSTGQSSFNGQIDQVQVFNNTRSAANIVTDLTAYTAPATPGLVAQYDFNEGATGAGVIYDRNSTNNFDLTLSGSPTFSDIATYSVTSRTANKVVFNRSYLTVGGGWRPAFSGTATLSAYGGGGGGAGGSYTDNSVTLGGAGGGGGGSGTSAGASTPLTPNTGVTISVGLGGVGGYWGESTSTSTWKGKAGTSGRTSTVNLTTAGGGSGGSPSTTDGVGGTGGTSGSGRAGSTSSNNDGGGGANSITALAANVRTGGAGLTDPALPGLTMLAGGSGGLGANGSTSNSAFGADAAPGTGSGGSGGGGAKSSMHASLGGSGSNGVIVITWTSTVAGQSGDYLYYFNGTSQYAETMPSSSDLNLTGDFTLETWINPDNQCAGAGTYCTIMGRDNNYLLATSNGTFWWQVTNSDGSSAWYNTGVPLVVGQWQHVALVRSGSTVIFYLNGQKMTSQANGTADASGTTISLTATSLVGPGWFEIASRGVDHTSLFRGYIDDVRVWNSVHSATTIGDPTNGEFNRYLTTTELAATDLVAYWDMNETFTGTTFYNRKTGSLASSDLFLVGSPTGVAQSAGTVINNAALPLDSTKSQTMTSPDSSAFELTGSNFTISAWWYVPACGTNTLLAKENTYAIATDSSCKVNVQLDPGNEGDAQTWTWMNTGYALPISTWHYVSVIKVGTTVYTYVDATLVSTIANGDTVPNFGSTSTVTAVVPANLGDRNTYFGIGSRGTGATRSGFTTQTVDDIRLWGTDRRAKQALDMAGFVPHAGNGLQVMYDFNFLAATQVANMAAGAPSASVLTGAGTTAVAISTANAPAGQPYRAQQYITRSFLISPTLSGYVPTGATSGDYWISGGGGGGGSGGTSGTTGAGGGAGALLEGYATTYTSGNTVTQKIGVGGRYAINSGDTVAAGSVAQNGYTTSMTGTGVSLSAIGGGAGGSGTATSDPINAGSSGGSGGGSGQSGAAGGTGSAGNNGGAGSPLASGGGGGARSAGADAASGAGGAGGSGTLIPARTGLYWAGAGGTGRGTSSSVNTYAAYGATAAGADALAVSGSGGGGGGFATAGSGTARGGLGANGFILTNYFNTQPFVDQGPKLIISGGVPSVALNVSLRTIDGNILNTTDTVAVTTSTVGCSVASGGTSTAAVAGQVSFGALVVTRTSAGVCTLTIQDTTSQGSTTYDVSVKTAPASINVTSTTTTAACSFSSGFFTCPNGTVATLNVTDLNAALDANPLVQLSTMSGAITTDPAVTITGSGALSMSAYTTATLKANMNLTGAGMDLTVRALGVIDTNSAATIGSPTTIQTNGGSIYLLGPGTSSGGIYIRGYNFIKTNGGNLMISGGANYLTGYSGDSGNNGIYFYPNASAETGAGSLTLRGSLASTNYNIAGVYLAAGSVVKSTSGAINIVGYTLNSNSSSYRTGIKFDGNSILSDSGSITINGDSSTDVGSWKTGIQASGLTLTTNSGNVNITGNSYPTYPTFSGLVFQTTRSTVNSGSGTLNITDGMTLGSAGNSNFDYLTIQGSGAEQITSTYPVFYAAAGFQAQGTGDLTIKSNSGGFYTNVNFQTQTSFGTGYQNITITDLNTATSNANQLIIGTKLQAANTVTLKGGQVNGSAGVVATHLASQTYYATTPINRISGSSDVVDAAFNSGAATPTTSPGITDINTFTPADVNGVTAQWAMPYKAIAGTGSAWTTTVSTCVNGNIGTLTAKLQDKWSLDIPASATPATTYTLTPSSSAGTSVLSSAATTPVAAVNGVFTFSNLGYSSGISTGNVIRFTPSPTLPGTASLATYQATGTYISVTASCPYSKVLLTAGSTSAISGQTWAVQPTLAGQDAYGNSAALGSNTYPTTVSLTSGPSGGAVTGTFTLSNGNTTGSGFKITGPTGTYVVTYTINGFSTTHTIAVTGWSVGYGGASLPMIAGTYPATFSGNGTGAVTYSTSTGTICSVNATSGAMTPLAVGTCTITANQATDGTAAAGSANVSITITKGTQATVTLTSSPTTLVYGSSVTLSGAGGNGTGGFSYQKVSGNCLISGASLQASTANAGDICVVTATKVGDANWNSAVSTNYSFTVAQAAQAAVTVPTGKTVGYGNATDLTQAPYTPSGGTGTGAWNFSTSSANCSIIGNLLTSTTSIGGTCVVAVKRLAQGNYADSTPVNMTIQTAKGSQTISYNTVTSSVRVGDTDTLNATSSSGLTVSYAVASGSSSYCSLQGTTVRFNAPGSCVINVTQSGDTNYNAATLTPITYTVAKGLQTITFAAISDDVVRTTTLSLGATSSSTLAVTYAIAAGTTNSACTVTSTGVVTLSAVGVCSITASQAGNANYEAATDVTQTFNVAKGTQSALTITSASNPQYGQTVALTATGGNGSASYDFLVVSGPCSIAGGTTSLILGDAGTSCVISVDRAGDANWNAATTATQTVTTAKAAQATLNITNRNAVVYGEQVAVTYGGGSGTGAISWSVNSPCSLSGTTLSVGDVGSNCVLSLSKDGDDNYLPATANLAISITRATQAPVTITNTDHYTYRQSLTLTATGGSGDGAMTFTATGSCFVSGGNLLSGGGAGTSCSVIATRAQSTNYNAESSVAMTIAIDKANQSIGPITVLGTARALGTVNVMAHSDSNLTLDLTIDSNSSAVCSISGNIVSLFEAGDCVVNANQAGDTNFNAATQVHRTITVAHASQTINLVNPGFKRYQDNDFAMMGSNNSSLPIAYSLGSETTGFGTANEVCSVDSQGLVHIIELGSCQIVANQSGDSVYDAATPVSVTFSIGKALQSTPLVMINNNYYVYGGSVQLLAQGGDGSGAVTFETGAGQGCSVQSGTDILSGGDAGSACTIRVLKDGDDHYEPTSSGVEQINIAQAFQTITFNSTAPTNAVAFGTYTLSASADSGEPVTFSIWSGSATVCSVNGNVVSFLTGGGCIVYADQSGNTNYSAAPQAAQFIGVDRVTQTLSWVTPSGVTFGDQPFTLQASSDSGLDLSYLSAGSCSVDTHGLVTIVGAGTCLIAFVQMGNDSYWNSGYQQITFNVARAQQLPLFIGSITSTDYGQDLPLSAYGGSGFGSITYETNGTCTVLGSTLTPGNVGTLCEVRATQGGDLDYEPISSNWVTITVNKAHQAPMLMTSQSLATYGQTIALSYTGGTVQNSETYVTTGTCTASAGVLTVGDAGSTCTVKAVIPETTNYLSEETPVQTITIMKADQEITFTSTPSQPKALGTYVVTASADSGDPVTFSISPSTTSVCSISGSTVTFLTSGTCAIFGDQAGNDNYWPAQSRAQAFSVGLASQTITFTAAGVKHYGDAQFSASATASSGLAVTYGLGSGTTNGSCLVASDGTVTIQDVGTCEVTADQTGDGTYAQAATATQSITIAKGTQQALSISSANYVTYGQTQNLSTSGGSGQGSVSYDASGDCTESNGVLSVGAVGSTCQVRATKAADSQYEAITSPWLTVSVIKAHQATLTISSANSVAYGSTLALAVSGGSGSGSVTYTTTGTCSVTNGILSVGVVGSSCAVTATKAESANYLVASSQPQTVSVVKAANVIHLNPLSTPVAALDTYSVDVSADSGDQVAVTIDSSTSSVCTASAGIVTFVTSGSCVINLNEDGNSNFNAATQVQETVSVGLALQAISFNAAGVKHYGDPTFQASAYTNSNLPITYSVGPTTTNNACSVASDGTVTILDVGDCEVDADQAGDNVYSAAATAGQMIQILKGTQATLTMSSSSSVEYGTAFTLATSGGSGSGAVTFATTGQCTQTSGILTVGTVGSLCRVRATKAADSRYNAISSVYQTVTVIRGPQATLTISSASNVAYDSSITLTTSGGSGNGAVTYMSGGTCYVSFGVLYPGAAGVPCVVRAHKAGDSNYTSIDSADFTVTVDKADQTISVLGFAVNPVAHDYYTPFVTASSNLNVDVSVDPSSSSVCSYGHGGIYFDTAGTCVINYDQPGDSNYNAAPQLQETITVAKLSQTISGIAPSYKHYGDSAFQIVSSSDSGLPVTYTQDANTTNNSCTVSSTGYVTILAPGTCAWIESQAGDASYLPTSTGVNWFSIDRAQQAPTTLVLSATSTTPGGTITMSVTGGSGNGSIRYVVGGTCTVSGNTLTVGNAGSQCTVYGIKEYDDYYAAEATFQQTITITRATQATLTIDSADTVVYGNTITLSTTGGSGSGAVSYATTGTCTVSNGILTVGDAGSTCTVTATKAQSTNYNAISSAAQTITITQASQTLSFTSIPSSPTARTSYAATATSTSGLTVNIWVDLSTVNVCRNSGASIYFLTSGTCLLNATQTGDTNYAAATPVQQSFTVAKTTQSLNFYSIPSKTVFDPDFNAVAESTSSLTPTYSLGSATTNGACSVTSSGTVSLLAGGVCYVVADQAGNDAFEPAPSFTYHFSVIRAAQATLSISSATSVAYGSTLGLTTSGGSGSGAVTYSTTGTCSVSGATLTVGVPGSACTVTAYKAFDAQYASASSATETITVTRATQATLTIDSTDTVVYGDIIALTTTGGSGSGSVTYSTTGTCYVTNAILSVGDAGSSCTVTATKAQSTYFSAASSAAQTITITRASQTISITSSPTSPTALDTYLVQAAATSGLSVVVSIDSSTSSACSVSGSTVTFLTSGSCVINANQSGGTNFTAASQVQQTITVAKKAQSAYLTIPPVSGNRQLGDADFSVSGWSGSGLAVTYGIGSSTTNNSCSINSSTGLVSILDVGECYITVNQGGNATWAVASAATGHFTIGLGAQAALTISSSSTVAYGQVINLTVTGGSINSPVSYTTTGTCTVNYHTLFVTDAGSACTVTAHKDGNSQFLPVDSAAQTITVVRTTQAFFYLSNNTAYVSGETYTLQTIGGSGDGVVSYVISGDCTLNGAVLTLGNAGAQCLVTATKGQSLNYDAISDQTRIISIGKANQSISITSTPSNPTALDTYTFAATAGSGAPVTATIDNASSTVCSISNNVVTYLTSGSCVINADQAGTSNYNPAQQVQQTIVVVKKAQTISWPTIAGQQFGVANFNAGASAASSLSIAYSRGSSTTNSACSVTSSGTVSILAAGECYLVADQAGDDTWAAAPQVTVHFNVLRGNQATLSMASASSVDYGSTISLSTTGGSGTGSVSYSTTGTCSVSGATLTVGNAGSACTVTATKALDAQYLAQTTAAQTITINRAAQATLTVSSIAGLKHGQTMTLTATGGSGTGAITYTASGACTVSGATLTGGNAGSNCVVYATKAQSTNYLVVDSASVTELVGKSAQTVTITSTPSNATALQTYTVSATASSGLAVSVAIASSTSTKCSVVGNVVTFNEVDSCVVEVSQSGDTNFDPATTVTQTISVARAMDIITIPTLADRTVFSTSLTVSATSLSGAQLTYTSVPQAGNVFNCSITTSGTLTLITPGRCEIEVTHADGSVYAAAINTARFMITRGEQATLSMTSASSVDYLGSIQLSASGGSGTGAISYTANGACAITSGVLTVADVGSSCSVTATRAGDTNYNAVTSATQTITVNQINQDAIIVVSAAHVRYGQQLPLVSAGGSGPGAETWSIDTTSVPNSAGCAINSNTLNLSVTTSGACDVVVNKASSRNYRSAVSPRFTVTADKAYQSVTFTSTVPTAPVSGDTYTVAATSSAGLTVNYSVTSASAAYCSISVAVVSFTGTGDCEIVASQAGDGRYLAAPDVSQTIAVGSLNQVITASNVRNHTYGDPAFVVVGETTSSSPVTFSLGSNTTANSCSVTSTGVVTILAVGHCDLVLSAAADAQYAAASDITKSFEIVADQASAPFITSVSADNQSVTLSFWAPSYIGGSAIRAYGINAYLNGVLAASYSGCAANQTSCTMTGLTNGLAYTFRMVAVNAAGDGAESSATGAVTPATHAEAVRQLVAVGVNTALDVTWAAPASLGGGTFDSYRIYVRPRGGSYPSIPTEVIYSYGATSKQLTGLVNGTSYDVKVVTITTANTVQLVSNTAEVLQYPKTIPDAPQSISLAALGTSALLVSWTAPISDGGDAVSTYAAQIIGGTNCSVSATTNACVVSGLVDGTTYTVSVVATNGAGSSPATEAQIVFHAATVASANQGNQGSQGNGSGGGSGPSNPVIVIGGTTGDQVHGDVWISLDKAATARANGMSDGVSVSGSLGGKLIFKGKGLGLIYSAYIGNHIPVKILSANSEQVVVQVPASKLGGWQDMWFFTDSHAIRYMDVIQYVVTKAPIVKVLGGFKPNAKALTQVQKGQLWKIVKQVGAFKQVDCKGSSTAAVATCKALKVKRPWVKIHVTKVKIS
ncbi:MAG: fibronectin type III domain-containing protein, partial [Rhodoluna sp.]|nr:fibronectin type III domain-containing protein [Rhodoluna sp.]